MTRRTCLWLFVLLAPALTPLASAAPVVDPLIGVRGTLSSSPAITDPTLQTFGSCSAEGVVIAGGAPVGGNYTCAFFDTLGMDIESLDLQFFDDLGRPFGVGALTLDSQSILGIFEPIDAITVRLSGGPTLLASRSAISSQEVSVECEIDDWSCLTGLVIFTAAGDQAGDVPASSVSVRAVNRISNVPEPAAMLLLGAGVVAAGARRRRRARPRS